MSEIPTFDGRSDVNTWLVDLERKVKVRGSSKKLSVIARQSLGASVKDILQDIEDRLKVSGGEYAWPWESFKMALLLIQGEWQNRRLR